MTRATAILLALVTTLFGTASNAQTGAVDARSLILGTWTWTRSANNCTESHTYLADGMRLSASGSERNDTRYELSAEPTAKGFWRLDVTTIKDLGGKDCADTEDDETGLKWTVYVQFDRSGNRLIYCYEESLADCYGPFTRTSRPGGT